MMELRSFLELPEACPHAPREAGDQITPEFSFFLRGKSGINWRAWCVGNPRCKVCSGDGQWHGHVTSSTDLAYLCGTLLLDRANAADEVEREFLHRMASELLRWSALPVEPDSH